MVIGLHGRIGAGKNECAKRLALLSPLPVVEVSFAAKLKQSAAALLGCSVADLEQWKNDPLAVVVYWPGGDESAPRATLTFRELLQRYGTEAHRDIFGADFWLDAALPLRADATNFKDYSDALYVVTDVRFPNEAQRVRDLGGVMVAVIGPDEPPANSHVSELPLPCDFAVSNAIRDDGFDALDERLALLLDALEIPVAA